MADGLVWRGKDIQFQLNGVEFPGKVEVRITPRKSSRAAYSRDRQGQMSISDDDGCDITVSFLRTAIEDHVAWGLLERLTSGGVLVHGFLRNIRLGTGCTLEGVSLNPIDTSDDQAGDMFTATANALHYARTP